MSALTDFVNAGREVIEELSRETLPNDAVLLKLLQLQRKVTDAVAEAVLPPEAL